MIKAVPFPWYGAKKDWASVVWDRLGNPDAYIEPFAGSAAILFRRPGPPGRYEVIVDKSAYIANFWRAVKSAPREVAEWIDWPRSQADMNARHAWLIDWGKTSLAYVMNDPEWYDAKAAGWWCWGVNIWIGGEWGTYSRPMNLKRPLLRGVQPYGLGDSAERANIYTYFDALRNRLRDVAVLCDDWKKSISPAVTGDMPNYPFRNGTVGVVLDPPYVHKQRADKIYDNEHQSEQCARESYRWAVDHGDRYRIVYFANEGDFALPDGWTEHRLANRTSGFASKRDVAFFSPACVSDQPSLFA